MRQLLAIIICFVALGTFAHAGDANLFNPYLSSKLPSGKLQGENAKMAQSLGAAVSSLQSEIHYRKFWRQEAYPVVFGNPQAPHEVLVFLDYAAPQSQNLWAQVLQACQYLQPQQVKVAIFAKNSEPYGTELMGGGIWFAYSHPSLALNYYTYTLQAWNVAKQSLQAQGKRRAFVNEYDATVGAELPILYAYLEKMQHVVPAEQHFDIVKYAFDAGNINMFQAGMAAQEYDVSSYPAVVVNGKLLSHATAQSIIDALR